jgi:hypothetical protein
MMARSLDGGGAALAQAVFVGEGITIEVIFAGGNHPAQGPALVAAGSGDDTGG